MQSHSLSELNQYIRQVIALNFTDAFWIHAEIVQANEVRGQVYVDLVDKDENTGDIKAQSSAIIWYKSLLFIRKKLGKLIDELLQPGIVVQVKVKVDFHERYGLKLNIEDIDPSYTFGQLELERQEIISKLEKENLIHKNRQIALPTVIQKIAVISSKNAAGYKDFINQLTHNSYGYRYEIDTYHSAVQGQKVESDISSALKEINDKQDNYDCIVITRGGGSKIDLSGFDSYKIAKAIANSPLPVITGIGHDIDQSIADMVSHTDVKTPTAVADFLIEHNLSFESNLLQYINQISQVTNRILEKNKLDLQQISFSIESLTQQYLTQLTHELEDIEWKIKHYVPNRINDQKNKLQNIAQLIELLDPEEMLNRGYSIVSQNGKIIYSTDKLKKGENLTIQMVNGVIESEIIDIKKNKK